jgi:hypothetical protein
MDILLSVEMVENEVGDFGRPKNTGKRTYHIKGGWQVPSIWTRPEETEKSFF